MSERAQDAGRGRRRRGTMQKGGRQQQRRENGYAPVVGAALLGRRNTTKQPMVGVHRKNIGCRDGMIKGWAGKYRVEEIYMYIREN